MTLSEIKKYLKEHFFLTFEYKSVYYSLQRRRMLLCSAYRLIDTDNISQQQKSLEELFEQVRVHDGKFLGEIINFIEAPLWDDPSWQSYEAVRHNVIVYDHEIHFQYNKKYYWIAHTHNGISHLSDDLGSTQEFNSPRDLFEHARIDNKSLKEIWDDVVVDAC